VAPWNLLSQEAKVEVSSGKSGFKVQFNQIRKKTKTKNTMGRKKTSSSKIIKTPARKNEILDLGGTTSSKLLNRMIPKYPYKSRIFVEEGLVQIEIKLNEAGKVLSAIILQSSQYERLDLAALEAARGSSFESAKKSGKYVPSIHILDFKFELND